MVDGAPFRDSGAAHCQNTNRNRPPCYERYSFGNLWFVVMVMGVMVEVVVEVAETFRLLDGAVGFHLFPLLVGQSRSRSSLWPSLHVWEVYCFSSPRTGWRICWTALAPPVHPVLAECHRCHQRYLKSNSPLHHNVSLYPCVGMLISP